MRSSLIFFELASKASHIARIITTVMVIEELHLVGCLRAFI